MTDSQKKIYNYILKYKEKHGEVPSTRTMAKHFKVSHQAISQHCNKLVAKNLLKIKPVESYYMLVDN